LNERRLWRLRHAEIGLYREEMKTWMPSKESIRKGMDSIFALNPWYHKLREEVRKKVAIDYGIEWKKLRGKHGLCRINIKGKQVHLKQVMDNQIEDTINAREKLMEEFIRARITTNISKSEEQYHEVQICVNGIPRGRYHVSKLEFDTWCKEKMKGGKV